LTRRTEKRTIYIMTTISATTARANFYDLIDKVAKSGKRVGITKYGVLKVVMISVKEFELLTKTSYNEQKK